MKIPFHLRTRLSVLPVTGLLLCALAMESTQACSVPVFYFALFEWRSDSHTLDLGSLPKGMSEASIKDYLNHSTANLELGAAHATVPAGHVQLRFAKNNRLWWDAPLPGDDAQKGLGLLMDSPDRQEIVRELVSGASVVWVFLDSGDKKADDASFSQITNRLKYLQKVLEIPPPDGSEEGPDPRNTHIPLKIDLHAIRVSRNDPREVGLVAQLLNVDPDLQSVKTPIAYPVIGRALLMAPIFGKNLNQEHIDNWTQYAAGACSCQVKDQNPGIDLLVSADWDNLLGSTNIR